MKKNALKSLLILSAGLLATGTQLCKASVPLHAVIEQNGKQQDLKQDDNGVYVYAVDDAPFSLLVPSMDAKGNKYPADSTQVRVCARTTPDIFKEIVVGANVQDTCLNSGSGMYNSSAQAASGMNLLVGTWSNVAEGLNASGSSYNTINFSRLLNYKYKMGRGCKANSPACAHASNVSPGSKIYLVVFADMNGNNVIDADEYTLIELDIH
jgi:hypothetical protein